MNGNSFGRIVNISALTGIIPEPGKAPYAISKAGINMMTEIVSKELMGSGTTINSIAPSIIDTPANRAAMPNEDTTQWVPPEHIADMICYLCSEGASSVSGTTIRMTGGR
jgi:NAD(P)-dependent dehydrogenase (short-subunit alcohol dehydrogenase family)